MDDDGDIGALRAAAAGGDPAAQFRLGLALMHGRGVPADGEAARAWCARAAEAGEPRAQFNRALLAIAPGAPAEEALRWMRLAAAGGLAEAEACLALVYDRERPPATWAEASTRASVALAPSGPGKRLRLAEYYVDPCLDLLMAAYRIERGQAEDIVQQFFCELEEPLAKGAHAGLAWKESLRRRYDPARGDFRALLRRSLVNFARDWMRRGRRRRAGAPRESALAERAAACEREWRPVLERFAADAAAQGPALGGAAAALAAVVGDGVGQDELAARLGVSTRSVRSRLAAGGEALQRWLAARAAADPDAARRALVGQALVLLPAWLRFPGAEKRARIQLVLALAG